MVQDNNRGQGWFEFPRDMEDACSVPIPQSCGILYQAGPKSVQFLSIAAFQTHRWSPHCSLWDLNSAAGLQPLPPASLAPFVVLVSSYVSVSEAPFFLECRKIHIDPAPLISSFLAQAPPTDDTLNAFILHPLCATHRGLDLVGMNNRF